MFEFINDTEERGQVGIGTLIVFIAMVLVAAIAAGVLINTAGFLQTQAEETGQDSTDQVANNINVIGTVGEVNNPDDGDVDKSKNLVYEIGVTVQKSPGAGDVDLSGLSIQYVGPDGFANLVHTTQQYTDSGNEPSDYTNVYLVQAITAETDDDTVMTSEGDRYRIVIPSGVKWDQTNLKDGGGNVVSTSVYSDTDDIDATLADANLDNTDLDLLEGGQSAELTITTESGSQRYVTLRVPDSLVGDEGGTVQL